MIGKTKGGQKENKTRGCQEKVNKGSTAKLEERVDYLIEEIWKTEGDLEVVKQELKEVIRKGRKLRRKKDKLQSKLEDMKEEKEEKMKQLFRKEVEEEN